MLCKPELLDDVLRSADVSGTTLDVIFEVSINGVVAN